MRYTMFLCVQALGLSVQGLLMDLCTGESSSMEYLVEFTKELWLSINKIRWTFIN